MQRVYETIVRVGFTVDDIRICIYSYDEQVSVSAAASNRINDRSFRVSSHSANSQRVLSALNLDHILNLCCIRRNISSEMVEAATEPTTAMRFWRNRCEVNHLRVR